MEIIKKDNGSLIICTISSILVVLKMYTNNNIYLVLFMLMICAAIVFDRIEFKFDYLLFFVSWVYALKFNFNQFSMFLFISALYIIVCIIYMIIHNSKFKIKLLGSYLLFVAYVIAIPIFSGGTISTVLGFLLNFTVIFFAVLFLNDNRLFNRYILIYSYGLFLSSIVRLLSYVISNLNDYIIKMATVQTLILEGKLNTRFAGLDLDPNYYSIQILIAISCLIINIYYKQVGKKTSIFLAMALGVFGFFSVSKMYLISFLFLLIIAAVAFVRNNIVFGIKFIFSLLFSGGIFAYFFYDNIYNLFSQRFISSGQDIAGLTTGRSILWKMFFAEIINDFKVLCFGAGFGSGKLSNIMAHNMYLTMLYYMGIIGSVISIFYFFTIIEALAKNLKQKKYYQLFSINSIPLYILLIANISLDSFVMDFFPIQLLLILFSLTYKGG